MIITDEMIAEIENKIEYIKAQIDATHDKDRKAELRRHIKRLEFRLEEYRRNMRR